MTFDELLGQVQQSECQEVRTREDDYCEVVVTRTQLESVGAYLQSYFGIPFKPEGEQPGPEAMSYTKPYGGIFKDQVLYHRKNDRGVEMALLWPWGGGDPVTLKIVRER